MENITKQFEDLFIKSTPHLKNGNILLNANEHYNRLLEKGIVKKRGYTLRGIEDIHLLHIRPNGY